MSGEPRSDHPPTERPAVAIAHVVLHTDRMAHSAAFFRTVGMRAVFEGPTVSVFELRGGTHLLLLQRQQIDGGTAPFDLLVDDLRATHERFTQLGMDPSEIEARPDIDHELFTVREPAGHVITFYSSHVSGGAV